MSARTSNQLHPDESQSKQTQPDSLPPNTSPTKARTVAANQAPPANIPATVYPEVDFEHQKWPEEQRPGREERPNNCITRQLCRDILRNYYEHLENDPSPAYLEWVGPGVKVVLVSQDETVVLVAQSDGPVRQLDWSPGGRLRTFLTLMADDSLINDVEEETECWGFKPDEDDDGIVRFMFCMGGLSHGFSLPLLRSFCFLSANVFRVLV
ncbi:uncharacterized protein E0L32_010612 [Thyridium curvatum]|uniref:Uncharacterized protein n=1 Tax=Thyridium curvatum TaxID=1093900 RepID=A0A507AME1_9PEZI|nr:uncharacterized protein E0L32_010612 [Thyridium curvatum]TPX07716.1 hypothetical protein E0L32_010612 [Thyridium curvatum]